MCPFGDYQSVQTQMSRTHTTLDDRLTESHSYSQIATLTVHTYIYHIPTYYTYTSRR